MIKRRSLLLTLAVSACASPEPRLHTLTQTPGSVLPSLPLTIAIRRPVLPRYAERREIVRLDQADGMKATQNDWWAEPLIDMVQRVLTADLAQRLPAAQVLGGDAISGDVATIELEIEFQRFESAVDGGAVLEGFVGIARSEQPRRLLKVQAHAAALGDQAGPRVSAMSQALGQAADQIAAGLVRWQTAQVL